MGRIYRCVVCNSETRINAAAEFVQTMPTHCGVSMEFVRIEE